MIAKHSKHALLIFSIGLLVFSVGFYWEKNQERKSLQNPFINQKVSEAELSQITMGMVRFGLDGKGEFLPCDLPESQAYSLAFDNDKVKQGILGAYQTHNQELLYNTPLSMSLVGKVQPNPNTTENDLFVASKLYNYGEFQHCQLEEINLLTPIQGSKASSPLIISGSVVGNWMAEGQMSATLTDANGLIIGTTNLTTEDDWMTNDFVSFFGEIEFTKPNSSYGYLIIKNANLSGMPANDKSLEYILAF